ncbi:MAG: hypothetical protein IPJ65_30910 [Archangiaceae bacterium]|nr:hypothetical protein [Archangiaceae bacterium]
MRAAFALLLCCTGCALFAPARTEPPAPAPAAPAEASTPPEAEQLAAKVASLTQHARAVEAARDDGVWAFWLGNAGAANPADPWAGHEVLLDDASLAAVRRARALKVAGDLDALEQLIVGERVGRAMRDAESAVANLEASVRFQFEGREVLYRELGAMLSNEKTPARRQALWAASLAAVKQVDAALAHRDEVQAQALTALGTTREAFGALLRRTALAPAQQWADRFLEATEQVWKARLAAGRITMRGDLPGWLKPTANLDAAFAKGRIAERGTTLLASLGLYGTPQLTLDLTDTPRKQPLPLTVSGVRLSFKPRGGWKDQQSLLAELGRALALRFSPRSDRTVLETTAELFASLAWNRAWLDEQQVPSPAASAAVELGADALLLKLRRAAASALATPDAVDRAYAIADDPARVRLDLEPLFAGSDTLKATSQAFALARHLEVQAGAKWWARPEATAVLRAYWQSGALPEGVAQFGENGESLLAALGAPAHGGVSPSR